MTKVDILQSSIVAVHLKFSYVLHSVTLSTYLIGKTSLNIAVLFTNIPTVDLISN